MTSREDHVSSHSAAGGRSPGKTIAVVVLAIIGVLAIVVGIIYLVEPAKSLPSILGTITHPASRASAHRSLRGTTAVIVGVICLVAAWLVSRLGRSARR
jgi:amino acid permease